jgi:hypothetical protein
MDARADVGGFWRQAFAVKIKRLLLSVGRSIFLNHVCRLRGGDAESYE